MKFANVSLILVFVFALVQSVRAVAETAPARLKMPPAVGVKFVTPSIWCSPLGATFQSTCYCFERLGDSASRQSFKKEVSEIEKLVAKPSKNSILKCRYVETGTCGNFNYLYCDSGQMGSSLRFFAGDTFIASVARSDYGQFCGGQARDRIAGEIPNCDVMKRATVLYGKGRTPGAPSGLMKLSR